MNVTQTEVESLRRMDVSVRPADRPDSEALVTVTGFYGTAIGAVGGSVLPWTDGQQGAGNEAEDGGDQQDGEPADGAEPPADTGQQSLSERVRRNNPPSEEDDE
jgi:hypothetical protein